MDQPAFGRRERLRRVHRIDDGERRTGAEADAGIVERALADARLEALAERDVTTLSGGERARALIARALAGEPEWLLADEPFAGLDPISMGIAARLIRDLNDALGSTSILVSHDVEETFLIADHVVLLANGRIVAQGSPVELRNSEDPLVRQFVHARPDGPVQFHQPAVDAGVDFGVR